MKAKVRRLARILVLMAEFWPDGMFTPAGCMVPLALAAVVAAALAVAL